MKERPIIFSPEMVRAILEGRKTQTRRPLKPQPHPEAWSIIHHRKEDSPDYVTWINPFGKAVCPYGRPGDRYWQSGMPPADGWYYVKGLAESHPVWLRRVLPGDYPNQKVEPGLLWGYDERDDPEAIEIEGLSLETVQWKRPGDRLWVREGWYAMISPALQSRPIYRATYPILALSSEKPKWRSPIHMPRWASRITLEITGIRVERVQDITEGDCIAEGIKAHWKSEAKDIFQDIWDSIYAKKGFGWDQNPWVWVIEFERIKEF